MPKQRCSHCGHLVNSAVAPRIAAQDPPARKSSTLHSTVTTYGLKTVVRARGVVLAGRAGHRGDDQLVPANKSNESEAGQAGEAPRHRPRAHEETFDCALATASATSRWSRAKDVSAAAGRARTTTPVPAGSAGRRSAMIDRSRRLIRLRVTAPPTARETAKPAMLLALPVCARYTTTDWVPALPPRRMTTRKSSERRRRWPAASTRPTNRRDPCGGVPSRWRVLHGCACAGGSRASWHAYGCSAEKSACSRQYSTIRGVV